MFVFIENVCVVGAALLIVDCFLGMIAAIAASNISE